MQQTVNKPHFTLIDACKKLNKKFVYFKIRNIKYNNLSGENCFISVYGLQCRNIFSFGNPDADQHMCAKIDKNNNIYAVNDWTQCKPFTKNKNINIKITKNTKNQQITWKKGELQLVIDFICTDKVLDKFETYWFKKNISVST